jgi:hypothetical protein
MKENDKNIIDKIIGRIETEIGCPLCAIIIDYEFDYLAMLQHKVAVESETRKEIADEGGFCDFHFRQFKKIASGKTNILLLKSIIEEGAYKKDNFRVECRVCKNLVDYEKNLIEAFSALICSERYRDIFGNTNGICFVHLRQVNNFLKDYDVKNWLNIIHVKQIEAMKSDFDNMSRVKSFYEINREKRRLINVLIEKLAGRKTGAL